MIVLRVIRQSEDGLPDVTVTYIPVGAGATYRPLARGADFAATVTNGTSPYGGYTGVAIVDLVDQVGILAFLVILSSDESWWSRREVRLCRLWLLPVEARVATTNLMTLFDAAGRQWCWLTVSHGCMKRRSCIFPRFRNSGSNIKNVYHEKSQGSGKNDCFIFDGMLACYFDIGRKME